MRLGASVKELSAELAAVGARVSRVEYLVDDFEEGSVVGRLELYAAAPPPPVSRTHPRPRSFAPIAALGWVSGGRGGGCPAQRCC